MSMPMKPSPATALSSLRGHALVRSRSAAVAATTSAATFRAESRIIISRSLRNIADVSLIVALSPNSADPTRSVLPILLAHVASEHLADGAHRQRRDERNRLRCLEPADAALHVIDQPFDADLPPFPQHDF